MRGQAVVHATASRDASSRDDWCTPACVLERVRTVGRIGLDPCTDRSNPTDAIVAFTGDLQREHGLPRNGEVLGFDGLDHDWSEWHSDCLVFVNPPYSRVKAWSAKIVAEASHCCEELNWHAGTMDVEIAQLEMLLEQRAQRARVN